MNPTEPFALKISFLGFGQMGSALAAGLARTEPGLGLGYFDVRTPSGPDIPGLQRFESALDAEEFCDLMVLCVKPGDMARAVSGLRGDRKYISIAAGLTVASIQAGFQCSHPVQIARVMPNISARIGASVSGVFCENLELREITLRIFRSVGQALPIEKEELLHAVTGLSGSGPAFVFAFIHALAEGGVLAGLPFATALDLAAATVRASAEMVVQSQAHPNELRNSVTSPGGTTIAGLKALEDRGFHGAVMEAVRAAADRSRELGV